MFVCDTGIITPLQLPIFVYKESNAQPSNKLDILIFVTSSREHIGQLKNRELDKAVKIDARCLLRQNSTLFCHESVPFCELSSIWGMYQVEKQLTKIKKEEIGSYPNRLLHLVEPALPFFRGRELSARSFWTFWNKTPFEPQAPVWWFSQPKEYVEWVKYSSPHSPSLHFQKEKE